MLCVVPALKKKVLCHCGFTVNLEIYAEQTDSQKHFDLTLLSAVNER